MANQQNQKANAAKAQEPKEVYVLNSKTGLAGYTFFDRRKFKAGTRYGLTADEVKTYAAVKVNGHQVLVKE